MAKSLATWFTPSLQVFQRSKGRSAVAAAAYRSCTKLEDERTGLPHDYTWKFGHVSTELFGVEGLDLTMADIGKLWNAAEKAETRQNSAVARELMVPLPNEWTDEQRRQCVRGLSGMLVSRYGVAVMASIHRPAHGQNDHVHIQFTTRTVDKDMTFGKKTRVLDDVKTGEVKKLREEVCRIVNEHAEQYGNDWYVYAGKFCEVEGMEEHIPTRHVPRLAAPEVIESIRTYNANIIEYRALKGEQKKIEEECQQIQKKIEVEEEKRRYYPKVPVTFEPFPKPEPKRNPAPAIAEIPQRKAIPAEISKAHQEMAKSREGLEKIAKALPTWKEKLNQMEANPPAWWARRLARLGIRKGNIDEYDRNVSQVREYLHELKTNKHKHQAVINNPQRIAACKTYDEITHHNKSIEALEMKRWREDLNKRADAEQAWIEKMKPFQKKPEGEAPPPVVPASPLVPTFEFEYPKIPEPWEP